MLRRTITACAAISLAAALNGCGGPHGSVLAEQRASAPPQAIGQPGQETARPRGGSGQDRGYLLPRRGFGRGAGRGWGQQHVVLTAQEEERIGLSTVRASYRPLQSQLQAMGAVYVPPARKGIVGYPFTGRIARVHVKLGEWVTAGQPVVTLLSEEVGNAKADYSRARAALDLAESSYEREKRLLDRGVVARKSYLAAENDRRVARSALEAIEKRLSVLGISSEQIQALEAGASFEPSITLLSPIAGKVVGSLPSLGAMVDVSTEILNLMDPTVLCVDAEIYERDLAKLKIGQEVVVTVPAYPGDAFRGRVCYIGDVVKPETRTITVRTEIDNRDQRLKPGMFAGVSFLLRAATPVLTLPVDAVLDNQDEKLVFVKAEGGYLPQVVQVGMKHGGYYEIVRGVTEDDEVVVNGNFQLKSKLFEEVLKAAAGH